MIAVLAAFGFGTTLMASASDYLGGSEIANLLGGAELVGDVVNGAGWEQSFSTSGLTIYINGAGERSEGRWGVRDDRYCSVWPPSNDWECYRVRTETAADGALLVIFVTNGGFETAGKLKQN